MKIFGIFLQGGMWLAAPGSTTVVSDSCWRGHHFTNLSENKTLVRTDSEVFCASCPACHTRVLGGSRFTGRDD